jgi:uncharacterized protein YcfL
MTDLRIICQEKEGERVMKSKMILLVVPILLCFLVVACSNVKDLKFTKDNQDQVMEKVKKSKDLTGEEVGLLMAAMMRSTISGEKLEGKTVGQVIAEQKRMFEESEAKEKEAKRLAGEEAARQAQVAKEIARYITVVPIKKSFTKADPLNNGQYTDKINLVFIFENTSGKDIKAFKGETVFNDVFGENIRSINLTYDEGIKAGQRKEWYGEVEYNQFIAGQRKFRDTELANMKFEWHPKAIIFADGTKIGVDKQ